MEIAVDPAIPTYSGGLGVLAGDMLRSAANLEVPLVAVTLLHPKRIAGRRLIRTVSSGRLRRSGIPFSACRSLARLLVSLWKHGGSR